MSRREALRSYFNEVVRDLAFRGLIRYQQGQTLGAILRTESPQVIAAVQEDFAAVLKDIGAEALGVGARFAGNALQQQVGGVVLTLLDFLQPRKPRTY